MGSAGLTEVAGLTPQAERAWSECYLAGLPAAVSELLLGEAREVRVESTDLMLRPQGPGSDASVYLIIEGLVRIYLVGPDGRQATVRYATGSEVIGLPPLLVAGMDVWAAAVTDVRAVRFSSRLFVALAKKHVELAWPTALYLTQQLACTNDLLAADIFLPVRARLARHLLDLAQEHPDGLLVLARHQHLADAIGSVREVVSREMKRLADERLITRIDSGTKLEDPAELHRISTGQRSLGADRPSGACS
jgi:CRP-like cAMP-binding protein